MMAFLIVTHFLFISLALAAPFQNNNYAGPSLSQVQRRRESFQSSINGDTLKQLDLAVQYAAASYCPSNSITPGSNNKVTCSSGNCPVVERSSAKILIRMKTLPRANNVTGFVADDVANNILIISFRGTQSKKDIFRDVAFPLVPTPSICWRCAASYGFWRSWNDVKEGVMKTIETPGQPKRRILVTGHSLGGAIASVAAADLRSMGYVADMYSFGAPRFANKALAEYLSETSLQQLGVNVRVTHTQDPVPILPFDFLNSSHVDIFPEYYISSPTNQPVKVQDIKVLGPSDYLKGSTGQMPKSIEAHNWYFNSITACASGTWLEGEMPSNEDFAGIAVGFLENWAFGMVDSIWNSANDALGNALGTALGWIGIQANPKPKLPSPTTLLPKDALTFNSLVTWLTGSTSKPK